MQTDRLLMSKPANVNVDPLLLPFLQAHSDPEADTVLAELISQQADPIVKKIVGYKFQVFFRENNRAQNDDAEDVHSEIVLNLLSRLSELRNNSQLEAIQDFRSYVAVTSYRACYEHLRRKYPQRYSLKNKLRYFLRHKERFALWETDESGWLSGFSYWRKTPVCDSRRLTQLRDHFSEVEREIFGGGTAAGQTLNDLLTAIFKWTGAAIELDDLVGIVAEAWKIKDYPARDEVDQERSASEESLASRSIDNVISERALLESLWAEIVKMSNRHCAALLLNLKDHRGGSALDLFLLTGVASLSQIAAVLGETDQWLAEIWNQLPLEDTKIAERLGLIRQQVINLRKTARLRLARHL
jgi:hypothetical protein